jgi:hypothetical protein
MTGPAGACPQKFPLVVQVPGTYSVRRFRQVFG